MAEEVAASHRGAYEQVMSGVEAGEEASDIARELKTVLESMAREALMRLYPEAAPLLARGVA